MFGGTAKTYATWKQLGTPFKENKYWYILVLNPNTSKEKKVRWYCDKAHAALQIQNQSTPLYKIFGFSSEKDSILVIKEEKLSCDEIHLYMENNWRYCMAFGGCWYSPKGTQLPPIQRIENVFECPWDAFKAEMAKKARMIEASPSCVWFE